MDWTLFDPRKDKRYGPFSESSVIEQIRRDLSPEVMCRAEDETGWRSLFSHDPFKKAFFDARGIAGPVAASSRNTTDSTTSTTDERSRPGVKSRRSTVLLAGGGVLVALAVVGWIQFQRGTVSSGGAETTLTGALTKEGARKLIVDRVFPKGAMCRTQSGLRTDDRSPDGRVSYDLWGYTDEARAADAQCYRELASISVVQDFQCDSTGAKCSFQLASQNRYETRLNTYVTFPCGSMSVFVEVLSTEGNKATAIYNAKPIIDQNVLRQVEQCRAHDRITLPTELKDQKQVFLRDDSGTWSAVSDGAEK